MSKLLFLLVGVCLAVASGQRARYDNYHVYEIRADNLKALELLKSIEGSSDSMLFLDSVHYLGQKAAVIVAPHKVPDFLKNLIENDVTFELKEKNAQSLIEEEEQDLAKPRSGVYDWNNYHDLEENYAWLESLAAKYPQVSLLDAGKTYEGRKILGIKISFKKGNSGIFIEGGIHSREWIGPATTTWIVNELLTSTTASVRDIAENYDWYIIPHANPDGYAYTRASNGDRMWRRTRSKQAKGCYGVDANRNWDFHWNEVGASDKPCSDTFAGPSAFSEIETKSLADFIKTLKGKIQLYISFHSYSQLLLYPYGHTQKLPANINDYRKIFDVAIKAIGNRYGTKYVGGNIYDAIYPASGASIDWAFGTQDVKLAFCYELRPGKNSVLTGFNLPKEQIIPTSQETLDSITAMISEAKKLNYFN